MSLSPKGPNKSLGAGSRIMPEFVNLIKTDAVARVVMNSPPVNSLSLELLEGLERAVLELMEDTSTRAVILESRLRNVFMAGADLKMILSLSKAALREYMRKIQTVFTGFESLQQPTIAVIGGHAMGGGCELALCCDLRFMATGGVKIGLPEINLGLMPAGGGIQRLRRLVGPSKAVDLLLFGKALTAPEALRIGLIHEMFDGKALANESRRLASELAAKPTKAIAEIKRCLRKCDGESISNGLDEALKGIVFLVKETEDAKEGIAAFNERRDSHFHGR